MRSRMEGFAVGLTNELIGYSFEEMVEIAEESGCDTLILARWLVGNPHLFELVESEYTGYVEFYGEDAPMYLDWHFLEAIHREELQLDDIVVWSG